MANTQRAIVRAEPALIREVAERHGLAASVPVSQVIRFALALAAGKADPHRESIARPGPKPKAGAAA